MGPTDHSYQMQISHNWAKSSPEVVFFPGGSGTPIPVSKLVRDLDVRSQNLSSPSAQCTEAVNNPRWLIVMIRHSFQDLSKSAFIALYGALVRPHLGYGMPACSPNLMADINRAEWNQRLVTDIRHTGCSGWTFILCSGDDFGSTWLPISRYSGVFWTVIRTLFSPSHSTQPKKAPLRRYSPS